VDPDAKAAKLRAAVLVSLEGRAQEAVRQRGIKLLEHLAEDEFLVQLVDLHFADLQEWHVEGRAHDGGAQLRLEDRMQHLGVLRDGPVQGHVVANRRHEPIHIRLLQEGALGLREIGVGEVGVEDAGHGLSRLVAIVGRLRQGRVRGLALAPAAQGVRDQDPLEVANVPEVLRREDCAIRCCLKIDH